MLAVVILLVSAISVDVLLKSQQDIRTRADTSSTFLATFDNTSTSPVPVGGIAGKTVLPDWDIQVHSRNPDWADDSLTSMSAAHGSDCSSPPATHENHTYAGAVFICKNHIMTSIQEGGYGEIVLTPDAIG